MVCESLRGCSKNIDGVPHTSLNSSPQLKIIDTIIILKNKVKDGIAWKK